MSAATADLDRGTGDSGACVRRRVAGEYGIRPMRRRYLTDVDHHDHEALGALDQADGRGVGIARYVRDAEDPQAAEIALTIVDDWQGRGLGTELLARLSDRGRQEGIRRFIALVAYDNAAVAGLLRNVGADLVRREPGAAEYEISLAPGGEHDHADRSGSTTTSAQSLAIPNVIAGQILG
jgi:RimJ/RimL family protein N-acetyltransferase